jgi:type IV pilus assembly protein PilY1
MHVLKVAPVWLLMAMDVCAAPPVLNIASEPLAAACRTVTPGSATVSVAGPTLLVAAAGGGDLFQATMDIGDWSGHFERIALLSASPTASWDAGAILTGDSAHAPLPLPAERRIYTSVVQADGTLSGAPFEWSALSAAQQALLNQAPPTAAAKPVRTADGLGELRLAYLRGDRSGEGTLFRRRGSVLGDSVHGTPVFVGPPAGASPGADYQVFRMRHKARRQVIYLGANDGMLHAFDAGTGKELYAYVPDALMPVLNRLPGKDYVHRAYVDGPAGTADALIAGNWRTVLVSGMGGGAQGVFALDVTDPERLDATTALWEFTDRDDPMMGNVTTPPQIAKVRMSMSGGVASYRYFAIVASGLNNYAGDGHASTAGKGALFLLALDKAGDAPWQLNSNYYRLITPIADATLANALSAPVLALDRDGALAYAYAGDLQGNLWRFDFGGAAPWKGAGKAPLFSARDASGKRQPIAQQPMLAYATGGGYMVLFGTGALIERADLLPASFSTQSFYAIHDSLAVPMDAVSGRRQLTERVLTAGAGVADLLGISGREAEPGSKGWYVDFLRSASSGERSIDSGRLLGGEVVFNTLLPGTGACGASSSRSYALNALSGLPDGYAVFMPSPVSIGYPLIGAPMTAYAATPSLLLASVTRTAPDSTGQARIDKTYNLINPAAPGAAPVGSVKVKLRAGRLSWREVANWRELHEALK